MVKKIKLLIADNNQKWANDVMECLADYDNFELCGIATNGRDALEMVQRFEPDVLVLNLILPCIDGLGVLEELSKISNSTSKPRVLCLSSVQNDFMVKRALSLGAAYFATIPIDTSMLIRRISDINIGSIPMIQNKGTEPALKTSSSITLDEEITSIFLTIGIPAHIKGYPFLREAVKMSIEDISIVNKITKELYPGIASKFDTTPSKVERAIRHAIDVAWNRGRIQNMNDLFGIDIYKANDRPTNGEFIALIADRLRMKNRAVS